MKKLLIYSVLILVAFSCNTDKKYSEEDEKFKIKLKQDSINRIGFDYFLKENYNEAILYFSKALELDYEYSKPLGNRAEAYYKNGQYDKAISDYTKVIELLLNNSKYENSFERNHVYFHHLGRGKAKYMLDDYRGAISDFDKVINNYHLNKKDALFYKGLCNIEIGNYLEACKNFSMAGELGESRAYDYIRRYCN